jgi:hypothetical protein
MSQLDIQNRYFEWFYDRVMEQDGSDEIRSKDHPEWTAAETVRNYMVWAVSMGFLHVFGDNPETPFAGILWRPIESDKLDKYRIDYWGTICQYDPNGDVAGVDFCYAPGYYPLIISFLKATGLEYTAWFHSKTQKLHIVPIDRMPKTMMLCQSKHDMREER